ncbi:hypothetical protein Q1695_005778 [Nippostrongylus brasiliensis]|nr:hypothetical protein Q1695_005778 [Nippostrongylus brasiliensis]
MLPRSHAHAAFRNSCQIHEFMTLSSKGYPTGLSKTTITRVSSSALPNRTTREEYHCSESNQLDGCRCDA